MSNIDNTRFNTRERATSSDLNRLQLLLQRAHMEGLSFMASGATKKSGCFGDSFIATPMPGTMKTAIGVGLALWADSTQVYPESTAVWMESREIREVTHDPADALTRYDVIEMRPGQLTSSTQARDVFDPITGAFTVQNLVKEIKSYPEFQIRKGTPAAAPSIPTGTAGWMPLAYVRVPGGAVSLVATDVVYCRPILAALDPQGAFVTPAPTAHATRVKGGGVEAAGGSFVAALVNDASGRFPGYYVDFRLSAGAPLRMSAFCYDGGLPAADTAVYFYAAPPFYPSGYDAHLAGREFWTPDTANTYGTTGGFLSTTLQEGCVIVASSTAPSNLGHPAGYSSGNGTFAHSFFGLGSTSDRSKWVYLGAASFEFAGLQIVTQKHAAGLTATARKPGKSFFADLPIAAPTQYNMWTEVTGNPVVRWPTTAREVQMHLHADGNNNSWLRFEGFDDLGDDGNDAGILTNVYNNLSGGAAMLGTLFRATLDTSGRYTIRLASHVACTTAKLVANCYRDAVLGLR